MEMASEGPADPYTGVVLDDRYEVLGRIGRGGTSSVYEGRHLATGRLVAIKVLRQTQDSDPRVAEIMLREARVVGMLGHPHIIGVLDVGTMPDGATCMVLELLHGVSLSDEIDQIGKFPPKRAVRIAVQVGSAMQVAHARGIIHRDLKPDNVFLEQGVEGTDHCKVLDFGVAKLKSDVGTNATLTDGGGVVGTPSYMAPEQLSAPESVDHRIDVYALGVILFEMLAGRPLFEARTFHSLLMAVVAGEHPSLAQVAPDVPPQLQSIVERAIAKRPGDRFETMQEMVLSLRGFANSSGFFLAKPAASPGAGVPTRAKEPSKRRAPSRPFGGIDERAFPRPAATGIRAPRRASMGNLVALVAVGVVTFLMVGGAWALRVRRVDHATLLPTPGQLIHGDRVARTAVPPIAAPVSAPASLASAATTAAPSPPPPGSPAQRPRSTTQATSAAAGDRASASRTVSRPSATAPPSSGARGPKAPSASPSAPQPALSPSLPGAIAADRAPSSLLPSPLPSPPPAAAPIPVAAAEHPPGPARAIVLAVADAALPPRRPSAALGASLIERQIAAHRSAIEACIAEDPSASGRVSVHIVVAPSGAVTSARPAVPSRAPVHRCLLRNVGTWVFAAPGAVAEGDVAIDLD